MPLSPGMPRGALGYLPALDGLRAIAVLAVMAYHSGLLPGGWLGVDVFFTLSGFLITTLLLDEHAQTGTVALGAFYVRRGLRLLPALVAFLAIWAGIVLATAPGETWILVGYLLGVLTYVANWLIIGWWPLRVFGHTWSLGIEEQFYLAWPVLLRAGLRGRPRWIVGVLLTAALASVTWRVLLPRLTEVSTARLYGGTDTHADGLLLGCALAAWLQGRVVSRGGARWAGGLGGVGGLALLAAGPLVGYDWGITTLMALATGGVLVAIRAGHRGPLAAAGLVAVGRISYGVYLWHWPIFWQLDVAQIPGYPVAALGRLALAWGLTAVAAVGSYVLLERPCLAYKARWARTAPRRAA